MTRTGLLLPVLLLLALPVPVDAQGYRGRARTYVSYVEIQDLVLDSLPEDQVPGLQIRRELADGTRAVCTDGFCRYYRSGSTLGVAPFIQDLQLNFWGGTPGLRGYVHLRARQPLGPNPLWPRSDQRLEVLAAYVEYRRSGTRVRGGRLWQTSPLGFYNFDGLDLEFRLPAGLTLGGYGGMSLVRGLNQWPTGDLLAAIEPLPPDENAYILGLRSAWRPHPSFSSSFQYQRETRTGGGELYSERIAAAARLLVGSAALSMDLKYDLATGATNDARLALTGPLPLGMRGRAEVRHYEPFFPLWTIWGAFSPAGFEEARGLVEWFRADGGMALRLSGAYRRYDDTGEASALFPIRDDAWRLGVGARLSLPADLSLAGEYRAEVGFGATRTGGDLALRRSLGPSAYIAFRGTAFETFSEFRVGSGRVLGFGGDAALPLGPARLQATVMVYRHEPGDRPSLVNWNQKRASLSLEIPIGRDPGLGERRAP